MHVLITLWVIQCVVICQKSCDHYHAPYMYSGVYVVPQWLENCFRKFDDYPIEWTQQRLSNMSFVLLRLSKGTVLNSSMYS